MLPSVEQAFVGRDEIRAPLKTPAWGATAIPVQRCTEKNARNFVLPVGKIALKPSINAQHDRYR